MLETLDFTMSIRIAGSTPDFTIRVGYVRCYFPARIRL